MKKPQHSATAVVGNLEVFVPLEGIIDFEKERTNLAKRIADTEQFLRGIDTKLKNKNFLKKAPKDVVDKESQRHKELEDALIRLKANLESLK